MRLRRSLHQRTSRSKRRKPPRSQRQPKPRRMIPALMQRPLNSPRRRLKLPSRRNRTTRPLTNRLRTFPPFPPPTRTPPSKSCRTPAPERPSLKSTLAVLATATLLVPGGKECAFSRSEELEQEFQVPIAILLTINVKPMRQAFAGWLSKTELEAVVTALKDTGFRRIRISRRD